MVGSIINMVGAFLFGCGMASLFMTHRTPENPTEALGILVIGLFLITWAHMEKV